MIYYSSIICGTTKIIFKQKLWATNKNPIPANKEIYQKLCRYLVLIW